MAPTSLRLTQRASTRNAWPLGKLLLLIPLLIAVSMFMFIMITLVLKSVPAVQNSGLANLFSTRIPLSNGVGDNINVGLIPGVWGTVLAVLVALGIAFPVALAMAIFASEFTLGGLGRIMEGLLSLFAGIPPVVYGLLSLFMAQTFMRPKFGAEGLPYEYVLGLPGLPANTTLSNLGSVFPVKESTLLGGVLLSLLIIPFMAPLMLDAIRSVPGGLKEGSLGLGATRWYTLWHVTLPSALSGIVGAISLGTLKAMGDAIIQAWAIGLFKNTGMPAPLWDVWERNLTLTGTIISRMNALDPAARGNQESIPYFASLLLVMMAFAILGLTNLLQNYLRRRLAQ